MFTLTCTTTYCYISEDATLFDEKRQCEEAVYVRVGQKVSADHLWPTTAKLLAPKLGQLDETEVIKIRKG